MPRNSTKPVAVAMIALAAVTLTACSSSDTSSGNGAPAGQQQAEAGLFEFQTPRYGSDSDLTIRIPDALLKAAGDTDGPLVTSATATARELDSSKYCAVDLAIDYLKGGATVLVKPDPQAEEDYSAALESDRFSELEHASDAAEMAEIELKYDSGVGIAPYEVEPAWEQLRATPADELDESNPETGAYVSDDYETLTFVQQCATSPMDDDSTNKFRFPVQFDGTIGTFASVEFNVMKSGALSITEAEVSHYERDSNGDWIGG